MSASSVSPETFAPDTDRVTTGTPALDSSQSPPPNGGRRRHVFVLAAGGLALLLAGYLVGVRSPWTAHYTRTVDATATRVPADVPAAYLKFGDERILFEFNDIAWNNGETGDQGSIPPCLRVDSEPVQLKAQVIKLSAEPINSGWYWKVISVTCPSANR